MQISAVNPAPTHTNTLVFIVEAAEICPVTVTDHEQDGRRSIGRCSSVDDKEPLTQQRCSKDFGCGGAGSDGCDHGVRCL